MNLNHTLRLFYWVNEYVLLKYSHYNDRHNIVLKREYVLDLVRLNKIIAKLEFYVKDVKDKENAVYMVLLFEREMNDTDFLFYDDFMDWAREKESEEPKD
jgi:hypothetical protein